MQRKYGRFPMVWRLEFQKRGAPHFHLLAFLDVPPVQLYQFVSESWYESCGEISPEHLAAGTNVQGVKSWRGVMAYAAKYMGKLELLAPGVESPGRFWGVWFKELLPISFEETVVTFFHAVKMRRIYRKFAGVRPRSRKECHGLTIFVGHSTTNRLLASYGYYRS